MYNGMTGVCFDSEIFIGPVYYQRLKQMVHDKQHARSIGPMLSLTRQPAEGRSRDGGFRIGEMERDVLVAHGMANFCRERLLDASDKYSMYICKHCGLPAAYNDGFEGRILSESTTASSSCTNNIISTEGMVHKCHSCKNQTEFALIRIPYAYKLLMQELQTINVVPRFVTE